MKNKDERPHYFSSNDHLDGTPWKRLARKTLNGVVNLPLDNNIVQIALGEEQLVRKFNDFTKMWLIFHRINVIKPIQTQKIKTDVNSPWSLTRSVAAVFVHLAVHPHVCPICNGYN